MKIDMIPLVKGKVHEIEMDCTVDLLDFCDYSIPEVFDLRVKYNIVVAQTGIYPLNGCIKYNLSTQCSRCLNTTDKLIDYPFSVILVDSRVAKDAEMFEDSLDVVFFSEDYIEYRNILADFFALSIPSKVICSDGCLGLCHKCGENLNINKCKCDEDNIDPRFADLKNFFKDE